MIFISKLRPGNSKYAFLIVLFLAKLLQSELGKVKTSNGLPVTKTALITELVL